MSDDIKAKEQLFELFEVISGCSISSFSEEQLPFLADFIQGQMEADNECIELLKSKVSSKDAQIKKLTEALESMTNFNMKLIDDHNKVNPPWDCLEGEHLHDAFKLLAEIKG